MEENITYTETEDKIEFTDGKRIAVVEKEKITEIKEIDGVLSVKLTVLKDYIPVFAVLDAAEVDSFFKGASKSIPPEVD